jgi:hypothetical protein
MQKYGSVAFGFALGLILTSASSLPVGASPLLRVSPLAESPPTLVETVAVVRRGVVARGPRGGVVARRGTAVVRPVRPVPARPVVVAPGWRRPAAYWWRPGAAVAAGAALGFVTAAAAASYAGAPPTQGYCWYYANPQRTQGFWDVCPR